MAHNLDEKVRTKDVLLDDNISFSSLLLPTQILNGLSKNGFRKPSPIQLKAIPLGRCGFDLIVQSKSGTGKTVVFAVIALETIDLSKNSLQCLILAPTREIAVQVQEVIVAIGSEFEGVKVGCFIGGTPYEDDKKKALDCHIAVGAPGRIKHLMKDGILKTDTVRLFVLDEADKLMESSFKTDINDIYLNLPKRKQMLALSATYENNLVDFLSNYMLSPTYITADIETPMLLGLRHFIIIVKSFPNAVPQMKVKNEQLNYILGNVRYTQCIIFSNYQTRAESLLNAVARNKLDCGYISAAQSQENRLKVLDDFKQLRLRILSSTDLTARGIDASGVDLVINYDVPPDAMTYLHRMGRAGRYGSEGICINIVSDGTELKRFRYIMGTIGGTNLSAPILKTLQIDVNLNTLDLSTLEQLYGQIPETVNTDLKANIINEVFTLKQNKVHPERKQQKAKKPPKEEVTNQGAEISSDILKVTSCNQEESQIAVPDADCMSILQQLAEGKTNILESSSDKSNDNEEVKKRKRCSNESPECNQDFQRNKQKSQDENFCRNMALLNTTKLLFSDPTSGEVGEDIIGSIGEYLKVMRATDNSDMSELDATTLLEKNEEQETIKDLPSPSQSEISSHSAQSVIPEDIFSYAYSSVMASNGKSWKEHFSELEMSKFNRYISEKEMKKHSEDGDEHSSNDEDDEMYYDEGEDGEEEYEVDEEYLKFKRNKDYAAEAASQPTLEWIPVTNEEGEFGNECQKYQPTHYSADQAAAGKSGDYFDACYQVCSDELWNNGLNFSNTKDFDEWFHQWQCRVKDVRDYVQQSIYVEEMNRYRSSRLHHE